ncbi:MAG: hypothetical protein Q8P38_08880 [Candidatus Nanopelagicales bacterium]|nr:hypothetical protein [Candidatus Nanopelagicales bacterium]
MTGEHGWDVERGFASVEPGDAIIFQSKYNPEVIRFDLTTKTPPPCP